MVETLVKQGEPLILASVIVTLSDVSDIRCFVFVQSSFGPSPSVLCIVLANGAASIHHLRRIEQLRQSVGSGMLGTWWIETLQTLGLYKSGLSRPAKLN